MQSRNSFMQNMTRIVIGTALVLMVPLVAMQFTTEVDWDIADFVVIGTLLIGTGFLYELIARNMSNATHRAVIAIVLVLAMLLIWADLAVGIFNIPGWSGS